MLIEMDTFIRRYLTLFVAVWLVLIYVYMLGQESSLWLLLLSLALCAVLLVIQRKLTNQALFGLLLVFFIITELIIIATGLLFSPYRDVANRLQEAGIPWMPGICIYIMYGRRVADKLHPKNKKGLTSKS
jgi:Zn-dependent protease with chaperone function